MSAKWQLYEKNIEKTKKRRKSITLAMKLQILAQHEAGVKVKEIATKFKLSHSTVSTILKNKDTYLKESVGSMSRQTTIIRKRGGLIPQMEVLLVDWMKEEQPVGGALNQATISTKALSLFEELKRERGKPSKDDVFSASNGWYSRFRKRLARQNHFLDDLTPCFVEEKPSNFNLKVEYEDTDDNCRADLIGIIQDGIIIKEEMNEEIEEFSIQRLSDAFKHIESAMEIFKSNDPNSERSSKTIEAMNNACTSYRELYNKLISC